LLADVACQFTRGWIMVILSTLRIGGILFQLGEFQGPGIHPGGVSAAMTDENRMLRQCFVEILQRERAIVRRLCVIVLKSENPFALGSFLSALSQCSEDFGDGAQIA